MKHTTLPIVSTFAALALTVALSGCVQSGRPSTPTDPEGGEASCPFTPDESVTTTAELAWQPSPNGDLVVKDKGVLEACMPNATINWTQFSSGGDVVQAFASGSADLGLVGSSPAARAVSAPLNLDVKVVWIYEVIGEAESLVVKDPAITDIEGLEGKTVGVAFGSTAHYSLLSALGDAGLLPDTDVKLINLEPDAMAAAWGSGEIDAVWVWNPVLGQLEGEGGKRIFSSADTADAGKPTYDVAMATTKFIDGNEDFMTMWAKAQDWAITQIEDDPDTAKESMAIQMGISPDEAGDQLAGYVYLGAKEQASDDWLGKKMGEDLAATAGFLLEQGSIDGESSADVYGAAVDAGPAAAASE